MPVQKYNWPEIKQDFMTSDYTELKRYFQDKYKIYNATIAMMTKWWTKDKQNYASEQYEKAQIKYNKEREEKWKKVLRNVDTARMAWLQELWERLVSKEKVNELQVREITEALKHMRLELWEATEINTETDNISSLEKLYNENYWAEED